MECQAVASLPVSASSSPMTQATTGPGLSNAAPNAWLSESDYLKQTMADKLVEHNLYINKHGQDLREIRNWTWDAPAGSA